MSGVVQIKVCRTSYDSATARSSRNWILSTHCLIVTFPLSFQRWIECEYKHRNFNDNFYGVEIQLEQFRGSFSMDTYLISEIIRLNNKDKM